MKGSKTLTVDELKDVLRRIDGRHVERNTVIVLLTHMCGLRIGEIRQLIWGQVVNGNGSVKDCIALKRTQTKGRRSRNVPLNMKMQGRMQDYADAHYTGSVADPVIRSQKGGHFNDKALIRLVSDLFTKLGYEGVTSHGGRKFLIVGMHDDNVPPRYIQEIVGHADLETTQRYIDAPEYKLRAAVESVTF